MGPVGGGDVFLGAGDTAEVGDGLILFGVPERVDVGNENVAVAEGMPDVADGVHANVRTKTTRVVTCGRMGAP